MKVSTANTAHAYRRETTGNSAAEVFDIITQRIQNEKEKDNPVGNDSKQRTVISYQYVDA